MKRILCIAVLLLFEQALPTLAQTYTKEATWKLDFTATQSQWADLNEDGWMDMLMIGEDTAGWLKGRSYINQQNDTFIPEDLSLPAIASCTFTLADIDNDNRLDLILSGADSTQQHFLWWYSFVRNTTVMLDSLAGISPVCADFDNDGRKDILYARREGPLQLYWYTYQEEAWTSHWLMPTSLQTAQALTLDYNNDGYTDLFLFGEDTTGRATCQLYRNEKDRTLKAVSSKVQSLSGGSAAVGDINSDGWSDLLISGKDRSGNLQSSIYLFQDSVFTLAPYALEPVSQGFSFIADVNHDGRADMLLSGTDARDSTIWRIYRQAGDSLVMENYDTLAVSGQTWALGDAGEDGNPDMLQTKPGWVCLLKNMTPEVNQPPGFPVNPAVYAIGEQTIFQWESAQDDTTALSSLTYELYVATDAFEGFVQSPETATDGKRSLVKHGSMWHRTSYTLQGLEEDLYYWGVASVDNAFRGSEGFCQGNEGPLCFEIQRMDTVVCAFDTLQLTAAHAVTWYSLKEGLLGEATTLAWEVEANDLLYYTDQSAGNCWLAFSMEVHVPADTVVALGADTTVCAGETFHLQLDTVFSQVHWFSAQHGEITGPDPTKLAFIVTETDTLWVEVSINDHCVLRDSLRVEVFPPEELIAVESISMVEGETTVLQAADALSYRWQPAQGLNDPGVQQPVASPSQTTTYYLEAVTLKGCLSNDSITVVVEPKEGSVFVPELFTPNGDGNNDMFRVYGNEIQYLTLQVYDRQGTKLFETNNTSIGWDGRFRDIPQPNGTYIWKIEGAFRNGTSLTFQGKQSGFIHLIR